LNVRTSVSLGLAAAFWLALAVAVVNGFARFAYALILPTMRDALGWDYAASGWLNTANSLGYALGGLVGVVLLARVGVARLFIVGLISTAVLVAAVGMTTSLSWMMLWRFLAGVGAAWVFSCGGALVAARYTDSPQAAGAAIAVFYAGGGLGMTLSGLLLLPLLDQTMSWRMAWAVLGLAGLVLAIPPVWIARSVRSSTSQQASPVSSFRVIAASLKTARMAPSLCAYFLFGAGYIVYLTFVVAWLRELSVSPRAAAGLWIALGMAVTASGWIWRGPMGRWWPAHTFTAACMCTAVGSVLPALLPGMAGLVASVLLVGCSFFMVPASIVALIRRKLQATQWAGSMNLYTTVFATGQALGPVFAGALADMTSLSVAMWAAAAILALGSVLVLFDSKLARAP
jgi:predicted MFS family arabinose efflux permease